MKALRKPVDSGEEMWVNPCKEQVPPLGLNNLEKYIKKTHLEKNIQITEESDTAYHLGGCCNMQTK